VRAEPAEFHSRRIARYQSRDRATRLHAQVLTLDKNHNAFEFVIVSSLRAAQLMRGCTPRVAASPKVTVTARREVQAGQVNQVARNNEPAS
jgi:DNA-directed RNA polymerase subunit K/omega